MSMSLAQMAKEVEAARAAWVLILDREKRRKEGIRILCEPSLRRHFMFFAYVFKMWERAGFHSNCVIDQLGFGKLVELGIEALPPQLRQEAWLSMAGMIAAYEPDRDPHVRAALGADWQQRLLEELPAAVRLAFNESKPGERIAPDRIGKGKSITSRAKRLMLRAGDEAAEKPKQVTPRRLEPEEMELALFAQQEAQRTSLAPEEDFFAYLSSLKPHQGEMRQVVASTPNVTVARWLDEAKAKTSFAKQETRVFDLLRETSDRHEVAHRLGIKPESVTRTKNRIKRKIQACALAVS